MDGVIVDSIPYHEQAWWSVLKKRGVEIQADELHRRFAGKTNPEILKEIFGNVKHPFL